jgi:hypothetical protein
VKTSSIILKQDSIDSKPTGKTPGVLSEGVGEVWGIAEKSAKFDGKVSSFATRDEARKFGSNEAIRREANDWFKKATNKVMEETSMPKYENFKVTEMLNGDIVMEYSAKADNFGYNKRFIKIFNKDGNELRHFKETIHPDGTVQVKEIP